MKEKGNKPESGNEGTSWQKTKDVLQKTGRALGVTGKVLYHMRSVFMAIPVVWLAIKLYAYAMENLPKVVGILLKEDGSYLYYLPRGTVSMGCMAVTATCLLMMFLSRRTLYPWLISIFSLVLPVLLIITNLFPA